MFVVFSVVVAIVKYLGLKLVLASVPHVILLGAGNVRDVRSYLLA